MQIHPKVKIIVFFYTNAITHPLLCSNSPFFLLLFSFYFLELQQAITSYIKVVPHEFHRKFYLRIFKWTIAFATWNLPNPSIETMKEQLSKNEQIIDEMIRTQQQKNIEYRDAIQQQTTRLQVIETLYCVVPLY